MRRLDYPILVAAWAVLTLPNLGAHALWDMDEGVNAGCAREMYEAGTLVVPVFNGELRSAKPVLLYWCQMASFRLGGAVNEWTARFPSALFGLGTVLVLSELARRQFGRETGLLAGLILASAPQFCVLSHAATPDAPLIFFVTAAMALAWRLHEHGGDDWLVWPAIPVGLAVLSKGPIGVAAPGLALLMYFAWNREPWRFLRVKLLAGLGLGALVVVPWGALVTAETQGEWLRKFLHNENLNRIAVAQENHSGFPGYYVVCLLALFAPWSSVLGAVAWESTAAARGRRLGIDPRPLRFHLCWILAFVVPFELVATKLPNYVAPAYPPLAVLTAWALERYRRGELNPPRWVALLAALGVFVTGAAFAAGFVVASGVTPLYAAGKRVVPGLEWWAPVGLIPMLGAAAMYYGHTTGRRSVAVAAMTLAAVGLVATIAAGPVLVIDRQKSAKVLATTSGADRADVDLRLGAAGYFQDSQSVVFYAGRRVEPLHSPEAARQFLLYPNRILFVPEPLWRGELNAGAGLPPTRVVARKYDLGRNAVVLAVATGAD